MPLTNALGLSTIALFVMALLSIAFGPVSVPIGSVLMVFVDRLAGTSTAGEAGALFSTIIMDVRLPHTVLMLLTGAALAGSGAGYQGLFRNPLADPYLIGVASGAGLGAVLAMSVHWPETLAGMFAIPAAAFAGALLTVLLVYVLARVGRSLPTTTLILAGVAVSSFATSLTSFLMLRSSEQLRRATGWLLGGAVMSGWEPVLAMLPYVIVGLGALLLSGHALNVMQFNEEQAMQLGLPAERVKLLLLIAASLATASAVAFSGIIGFLGLIVPHILRMLWGADYRRVLPLSILGGATMLLLADLISRVVLAPQIVPVGIVTALAGAPFFLWVLRRSRNQGYW